MYFSLCFSLQVSRVFSRCWSFLYVFTWDTWDRAREVCWSLYISSAQNLWAFPLSFTHIMGLSLHCHCCRLTTHLQVTRSSKLQARWLAQLCQQTNQHYTFSVLETVSQIRCCISLTSDCCFTVPPPKMPAMPLETPFSCPLKNTRKRGKSQAVR